MTSAAPDQADFISGMPATTDKSHVEIDEHVEKHSPRDLSKVSRWDHLSRKDTLKLFWKVSRPDVGLDVD